jgi:hypothetical protein
VFVDQESNVADIGIDRDHLTLAASTDARE